MAIRRALELAEIRYRMILAERHEYDWHDEIECKEVAFYVQSNIDLINACGLDQDFDEIY